MTLKQFLQAAVLLALLSPGAIRAAETELNSDEVLALARYHQLQGRTSAGRDLVVELLNHEPEDIAAHRWYILSWYRNHESLRVGEQYRRWLEEEPDDELRRLTRALSFSFRESPSLSDEDCAELESLLNPLPEDPERRAAALWRQRHAYRFESCEGDEDSVLEQVWLLARKSALARTLLGRDSANLPLDERWLSVLQRSYRHNAANLRNARILWKDPRWEVAAEERGEKKGAQEQSILDPTTLKKARKHALHAAKKATRSGGRARLEAARSLFVAAGQQGAAAALELRLKDLDELWTNQDAPSGASGRGKINKAIRAASRRYKPEQRLSSLNAMEGELGDDATVRATWLQTRSRVLTALGREDEAIADLATAYSLTPDNPSLANEFAWQAALAGLRHEEALAASESAITAVRAEIWRPIEARLWPGSFEEWSKAQLRKEASYIDTRAWLLYRMGRYEEAAESQREALRLLPGRELHLHMGLIYSKLERPHEAIGHLSRGLRGDSGSDDPIEKEGREVFEQLFSSAGLWHPGGPGAYLSLVEERRKTSNEDDREAEAAGRNPEQRKEFAAGTPFPDLSYRVDEVEQNLSDLGGLLLVDLWATWCGPCVKGMPHLDEVARNYKKHGLTTLALSVDAKQQEPQEFFEGESDLAFLQGWVGKGAMKTVGIRGIPAVFILDEDLKVLGYVAGYMDGDQRIEKILNTHLQLDE